MSGDFLHHQLLVRLLEIDRHVVINIIIIIVIVVVNFFRALAYVYLDLVEDVRIRGQRVRRWIERSQVVVQKVHYLGCFNLDHRVVGIWTIGTTDGEVPVDGAAVEVDETGTSALRLIG